jgi:hypothetical protein
MARLYQLQNKINGLQKCLSAPQKMMTFGERARRTEHRTRGSTGLYGEGASTAQQSYFVKKAIC